MASSDPWSRRRLDGWAVCRWLPLLFILAACHSWRPPPVDLADPLWSVTRGQAVWRPAGSEVELAGELLMATAGEDRGYLQFSKGPLVLAEVHMASPRWEARLGGGPRTRTFSGSGVPSPRLAWCQLLRVAMELPVSSEWDLSGSLSGHWRLAHRESGEWLEGTCVP